MKSIYTLVPDIQALLKEKGWMTDELRDGFAEQAGRALQAQFNDDRSPGLRLSKLGPQCPKALWHSIHTPELAEQFPAWTENKFAFGHLVEAWALTLAKGAGHRVEGEQDVIELMGIPGHRDCVINGCIVDVKSASSLSFKSFKDGSIKETDSFGYLDQLDAYTVGSYDDPLVTVKDRAYLLVIDKQLGHMVLYEHTIREEHIRHRAEHCKTVASLSRSPECTCKTEPYGSFGVRKLGLNASYSPFKHVCFPNLRTDFSKGKPIYLVN